jgi:hypothetical protein
MRRRRTPANPPNWGPIAALGRCAKLGVGVLPPFCLKGLVITALLACAWTEFFR